MIVTINTDASYSYEIKRGSFAYWMVSNEFKFTASGMLKNIIDQVYEAEFQCILNALYVLAKHETKTTVKKIIVNTDCTSVMDAIKKDKKVEVVTTYKKFKQQYFSEIEIEFRHVKAHKGTNTPRKYVNDWCDKAAKRELRKFIKANKVNEPNNR